MAGLDVESPGRDEVVSCPINNVAFVPQLPGPETGGIASPRSVVLEAHGRPDPAFGYVHNDRPVPGARGRAPSPRQVPITQSP
jgi:hypothetical protein